MEHPEYLFNGAVGDIPALVDIQCRLNANNADLYPKPKCLS